jgi:hypothetical protein
LWIFFLQSLIVAQEEINESCSPEDEGSCEAGAETIVCIDEHANCDTWASQGECYSNPGFMLKKCLKSCKVCDNTSASGKRTKPPMEDGSDLGKPQTQPGNLVLERMKMSREYMETIDVSDELFQLCRNENEDCTIWAVEGECDTNPTCE